MQADTYDNLWKKASQAATKQHKDVRNYVDKIYMLALRDNNTRELTRALYAYDDMGVVLCEDSIVRNAKRVWAARRLERNNVQHVLLTHLLGRLTDNDYLLALSMADTTFLKTQRVREHLPLVKGYTLYSMFADYLRERDMPDSVFVGWQRPVEEDTTKHKNYNFDTPTPPTLKDIHLETEVSTAPDTPEQKEELTAIRIPSGGDIPAVKTQRAPTKTSTSSQESPTPAPAPLQGRASGGAGSYSYYVFNVPGGLSRTCLVEAASGRPVKQWQVLRTDGRGQEDVIRADGNGHVWQRPRQIHNYDGLYDWQLSPIAADDAQVNALSADDFHKRSGWNAGEQDTKELRLDILSQDASKGTVSLTLYAPHRNIILMRDITAHGKLIEQRQYAFSDFIHFDLQWREAWGDEALITFAYALNGHLYTAELKISRPRGL